MTTLLDYATDKLDVLTGPGQTLSLDMAASDGELTRASGALSINLFNFFSVEGEFGFEKKVQAVTLSTGETIDTDYMGIGASNVSAFAGVNGGSADRMGLVLGEVDFALALMTDRSDATRKFTTLKATAGSVSFTGIDGLVVEADTLSVAINKGYATAAQAEKTMKVNTTVGLSIDAGMTGGLDFTYRDVTRSVSIDGSETDAGLGLEIKTALEGFADIGAGNVTVTGSKLGGYTIEFMGTLAGQNVEGLTVSTSAPAASVSVTTTKASAAGSNEVKQISDHDSAPDVLAGRRSRLSEVTKGTLGASEAKYILFTDPYNGKGTYDISLTAEPGIEGDGCRVQAEHDADERDEHPDGPGESVQQKYPSNVDAATSGEVRHVVCGWSPLRHHLQGGPCGAGHSGHHDHEPPEFGPDPAIQPRSRVLPG